MHCYVNEPVGDFAVRDRELPLARLKTLVDEMADAGCLTLLLTGGEVLVRPDFPELYLYAIRKGLLVTVFTNGTLVTERIADLFDEYRPLRGRDHPLRDDARDVREGDARPGLLRQVHRGHRAPRPRWAFP